MSRFEERPYQGRRTNAQFAHDLADQSAGPETAIVYSNLAIVDVLEKIGAILERMVTPTDDTGPR